MAQQIRWSQPKRRAPKARTIPQSEWSRHKAQIHHIYIELNKTCNDTLVILAQHGFEPR